MEIKSKTGITMIVIDSNEVKTAIKKVDMKQKDIARELGVTESCLSYCITHGRMQKPMYLLLCRILNVDPIDLIAEPKNKQKNAASTQVENENSDCSKIRLNVATMMFEQKRHNEEVERQLETLTNILNGLYDLWAGEK